MMTYTLRYFPVHFDIEITRRPYGNAALIASSDLGFDKISTLKANSPLLCFGGSSRKAIPI